MSLIASNRLTGRVARIYKVIITASHRPQGIQSFKYLPHNLTISYSVDRPQPTVNHSEFAFLWLDSKAVKLREQKALSIVSLRQFTKIVGATGDNHS